MSSNWWQCKGSRGLCVLEGIQSTWNPKGRHDHGAAHGSAQALLGLEAKASYGSPHRKH